MMPCIARNCEEMPEDGLLCAKHAKEHLERCRKVEIFASKRSYNHKEGSSSETK